MQRSVIASALPLLRVSEVMHPGVIWSQPAASVAQLAATIVSHRIHAVVLSSGRTPPLVVTDLELLRAALERPDVRAGDIAREPLPRIRADASLEDAVKRMTERYLGHLLVTDPGSDAPAGILSSFDIVAVLGGHEPRYARMVRPGAARPAASAQTMADARAGAAMHPGIITCKADARLTEVARTMAAYRLHCVAVAGVDRHAHLTWGLVNDLELVIAANRGDEATTAGTVAAAPVAVEESDGLDRVAALMVDHQTGHVVVVDWAGHPAGVISTLDVAEIIAGGAT